MVRVTCPKCGADGWLIRKTIKGKTYYYVDHYAGGKHKVHYLGPSSKLDFNSPSELAPASKLAVDYELFKSIVEKRSMEGDEDAKKLLKRIEKDRAVIERTIKLLITYLESLNSSI
ncbi:MAG: hypothetical protein QW353_01110 [Candidatus Korarchaeum sp.]